MTRKDYVAIAKVVKNEHDIAENEYARITARAIARQISDVMARDNPRFDGARFLKACGVQS